MLDPLLLALSSLPGGTAVSAPLFVITLDALEIRGTGQAARLLLEWPSADREDVLYAAMLAGFFDAFPDVLRLSVTGRLVYGGPLPSPDMTSLTVMLQFPVAQNPALGTGSVVQAAAVDASGHFTAGIVDLYFDSRMVRPSVIHGQAVIEGAVIACASCEIEIVNIDVPWLLAIVDRYEPMSRSQNITASSLGFLTSLRKVINSSPDFDRVVASVRPPTPGGRRESVGPLFWTPLQGERDARRDAATPRPRQLTLSPPGASRAMGRRVKTGSRLRHEGESISIGHVLIGVEGGRLQSPLPDPPQLSAVHPMFYAPDKLVTWAGDLGGALQKYITENFYLRTKGALDFEGMIAATASRSDLIGDIDGVNLSFMYRPEWTLAQNLRAYYVDASHASRLRFSHFVSLTEGDDGTPALRLVANAPKPMLTGASRDYIARQIQAAAILTLVRRTDLDWNPPKLAPSTDGEDAVARSRAVLQAWIARRQDWHITEPNVLPMLELESTQIRRLTDLFVNFIQDGLAAEGRP